MKRSRVTEEQIKGVLREAEAGTKTADLARRHGESEATLYNWKAKYGGLEVSEAKCFRALVNENGQLKRLLADAMLGNAGLTRRAAQPTICCQKMVPPATKREAVAHLQALLDVSEQRACKVLGADRTTIRYCSRHADDEDLREKLRALAPVPVAALPNPSAGASSWAQAPFFASLQFRARPGSEWPPVPDTQHGR